jgi:hypothetical protein
MTSLKLITLCLMSTKGIRTAEEEKKEELEEALQNIRSEVMFELMTNH